ncbi:MAG: CvpA family protein [Anaerolineae bacterium]
MIPWVDVFMVLFVLAFGLLGLRSGFVHESVTLLGLAIGLGVAGKTYALLGPHLVTWMHTSSMADLAAFLLILAGVWLMMLVVGAVARSFLEDMSLGWLDNVGGGVFGVVKGLFLAGLIVLVLMVVPVQEARELVVSAPLCGWMARQAPAVIELIPPVLRYWQPL